MKTNAVIIFFVLFVFQLIASAQEILIIEARRNITLADEDPVYKDYYLNVGEGSGLRKNLVVNVKRRLSVKDNGAKTVGDFETIVGQAKIIHVGTKVAVAREYKLESRDEAPMLEQIGIMVGDRLDLTDSFIDNKPFKRKAAAVPKAENSSEPIIEAQKSIEINPESTEPKQTASTQLETLDAVKNPAVQTKEFPPVREPADQNGRPTQAIPEI